MTMLSNDEVSIKLKKDVDISNAIVILGSPTVGLIGSIAGNYIANSLKLEQIGSIHSKYFVPSVLIRDSKPIPPVRIYYAGDGVCKNNKACDHLVTIVSEFPIPLPAVQPLIDELFGWTDEGNISFFLALEGIKSLDKEEDQVDVYGVGSTSKMVKTLNDYGIEKIENGLIGGFTGALLLAEAERNKDMLCMLTEAHSAYPDSRAAGRLLEKVDDMLPGIHLDLDPLYEEAEKIEKSIRKFMEQSKSSPAQMQPLTQPPMYS